jgi:hypothetical protein
LDSASSHDSLKVLGTKSLQTNREFNQRLKDILNHDQLARFEKLNFVNDSLLTTAVDKDHVLKARKISEELPVKANQIAYKGMGALGLEGRLVVE